MLRPMGIGELLDASFRVFRRRFKALALCVLVVVAPLTILGTLLQASAVDGAFDLESTTVDVDGGTALAGFAISQLLTIFAVVLATAACFRAVEGDVRGEAVDWRDSLRFGLRRSGGLLLALIIYVLAVLLGFIVIIVPGIWIAVAGSLVAPVVLFERRRAFGALRRSVGLVSGHWWRTFGAELIMLVLVNVLQLLLGGLVGAVLIAESSNEVLNATVVTVIGIIGYVISLPLQSALFALIYFDLRVRKEGFDIEMLSSQIGAPGEGGLGGPASPWARPPAPSDPAVWPPPAPSDPAVWPPPAPERPGGFLPPEPPR